MIDRELIQKAKDELGDRNAELIVEAMDLRGWNESTMKAICPWHDDTHPSLSYNRKDHNFHCFVCDRSMDIVEAFMDGQHMTFTEACKDIFDYADMRVQIDPVFKNREYRYPKEENAPTQEVYDYLAKRGISKETVDKCNVGSDDRGNIVFHYYDERDSLLTVKYRPSHKVDKSNGELKTWCQKGADTTPVLFNMNRVNPDLPLLICEGEIDSMAAIESGWINAVSVPFGAQTLTWIDKNWDWLNQFEEIILAGDNDDPGKAMNTEVTKRLGTYRCKTLEIPDYFINEEANSRKKISDVNEVLFYYGKEYLFNLIKNAKEAPIDSVIDLSDVEYRDVEDLPGVKTGIAPLDREIGKLYFGSLTLITGTAGSGKSSLLTQIMARVMDAGYPIFVASLELPEFQTKTWFNSILAGESHISEHTTSDGTNYYRVDKDAIAGINKEYRDKWFVYKSSFDNDIDSLLEASMALYKRKGVRCFLYDNLLTIDAGGEDELQQQAIIIKKLLKFSQDTDSIVCLVAHPRKIAAGSKLSLSDVSGTSKLVNLCHIALSLRRCTEEDIVNNPDPYDVMATVLKNRFTGIQGHELGMWYSRKSRRFYSNEEELNYSYSWDKNPTGRAAWNHEAKDDIY